MGIFGTTGFIARRFLEADSNCGMMTIRVVREDFGRVLGFEAFGFTD